MEDEHCPECGAVLNGGRTCQDDFYQMLYWENERPAIGDVHHLMVLCYHLQHPSLYSPDGLRYGRKLLEEFLCQGVTTQDARARNRGQLNSSRRTWKVTSRQGQQAAYASPPRWTLRAADVVAGGIDRYQQSVKEWAESVQRALEGVENG